MALIRKGSASGALKTYLDASKQPTVMVSGLEKHLLKQPPDTSRSQTVLHPSEVASDGWCPRYAQLVLEEKVKVTQDNHRLRTQSIFAEGHAIHDKWQTWLGDWGVLYGRWACIACSTFVWSYGKPTDICEHPPSCIKYAEVPLDHGIWGGHADGLLTIPGQPVSLLEIKSIGTGSIRYGAPSIFMDGEPLEKMFGRITQPFPSHMRQIQIYMELAERIYKEEGDESVVLATDQAVVLYELKSNQEPKEFIVKRDDTYIADILEWTDEIESLLGTGTLIECPYAEGRCKHEHP